MNTHILFDATLLTHAGPLAPPHAGYAFTVSSLRPRRPGEQRALTETIRVTCHGPATRHAATLRAGARILAAGTRHAPDESGAIRFDANAIRILDPQPAPPSGHVAC